MKKERNILKRFFFSCKTSLISSILRHVLPLVIGRNCVCVIRDPECQLSFKSTPKFQWSSLILRRIHVNRGAEIKKYSTFSLMSELQVCPRVNYHTHQSFFLNEYHNTTLHRYEQRSSQATSRRSHGHRASACKLSSYSPYPLVHTYVYILTYIDIHTLICLR